MYTETSSTWQLQGAPTEPVTLGQRLILALYTLLLYLATPLVLLRLVWRGLALSAPDYMTRWVQRFGWFDSPRDRPSIWLHAVSVGEINAAIPLIRKLTERYPDHRLVVTTVTPTGSDRVRQVFGDSVFHVYAPYDLPGAVKRFFQRVEPELAVIMETEIWPNLFWGCRRRGVPLVMVNARISVTSAARYRLIKPLLRLALSCVDFVAAQSRADAQRLQELGADPAHIGVMGNIKFDQNVPDDLRAHGRELCQKWGAQRPTWIAASTHEGEEEAALVAHARLRQRFPDLLMIVVPRHPERFDRVIQLARQHGFQVAIRDRGDLPRASDEVFVINTMGELLKFYACADVALVGGSLATIGGHNVLEPAALGVPVVVGPHTVNFEEIRGLLEEAGALQGIESGDQLADTVATLLDKDDVRKRMGEAGVRTVRQHRGSVDNALAVIEKALAT